MHSHVSTSQVETSSLLTDEERPVVEVVNAKGSSPIILVCEHASNFVPVCFDNLGLTSTELTSHIAWDPGARQVAMHLSRELDAPLVASRISRLVYDCNRPPHSDSAMPAKSETFNIPGNINLSQAEKRSRIDEVYRPFANTLAEFIKRRMKTTTPMLITVHSFSPVFFGRQRDVELGVLHSASDSVLADRVLNYSQNSDLKIRRNQPYGPEDGVSHTLIEHGVKNGLQNVMFEIRNDLIRTPGQVASMSTELMGLIRGALNIIDGRQY